MLKTPRTSIGKHICTVPYIPDDLLMFQRSENRVTRIRRFFMRLRMASPLHPKGHSILDSFYCYVLEHRKQLLHPKVIHPFSNFYLIWQGAMAVIFYGQFISIPLDVSLFNYHIDGIAVSTWNVATRISLDVICMVDVILRFFVGYVDPNKQEVVLVPKRIALNYVLGFFIFDLVSSFTSLGYIVSDSGWVYNIRYCGLFKLVRVFTFATYCEYIGQFFHISFMARGITILISIYLLFVHAVTCLNIFLVNYQENIDKQQYFWRLEEQYDNYLTNYCRSMYTTLKMINYLEIGFKNLNRFNMTYMIVVWIICKLVYIWLISYIMKFVITRRASSVTYIQLLRELKEYMRYKQVPEQLQRRLVAYYEFSYQKNYFKESDILDSLSSCLRQEINTHKCMKLVESVIFFEGMPTSLHTKIVSCLHHQVFLVNDVVYKCGSSGDSMFIIAVGSVAVYGQKGTEICHLRDGHYFGEVGLMERGTRYVSIVAVEICELYELYHADFKEAMKPYPRIYDRLLNVAERRRESMKIMQMKNLRDKYGELTR